MKVLPVILHTRFTSEGRRTFHLAIFYQSLWILYKSLDLVIFLMTVILESSHLEILHHSFSNPK